MRRAESRIEVCVVGAVMLLCGACQPANPPPLEARQEANSPAMTNGDIVVSMGADGRVLWNGEEVSHEELKKRATAAAGTPTELRFLIDGKPQFDQIRPAMEILETTGLLKNAYVLGGTR